MKKMNKTLIYHSIGGNGAGEIGTELYCVEVDKFREQIKLVKQEQSINATVITFDDGLEDNFTNAYPILKEFGLKAYFFVMPVKIETKGYMNQKQLREMVTSGMIIGSHGMTHRILTKLNDTDLNYELSESKSLLEEKLGAKIDYFSVPRGFYDKRIVSMTKKIGYKNIFTSNPNDNNGFCIGRIAVKNSWDIKHFSKVIINGLTFGDRIEKTVKNIVKNLLGAGIYDKLRERLLQ